MTATRTGNGSSNDTDTDPTPRRRRPARLLVRIVTGLLTLVVAVAVLGAAYQAVASWRDDRAHPAPGSLVDVGDHRLHLWCSGTGSPTVVLEAGLGGFSSDWSYVREDISDSTRVCAYDRAGYGWSDPVDSPLTTEQVARDLHALLDRAGEAGPYVMVGHSAGGIHVRSFARSYPDEVRGMVLVDSSHENQGARLDMLGALDDIQRSQLGTCSLLSPLGLMRALGVHDGAVPGDAPIPDDSREAWLSRLYQGTFCNTALGELETILLETEQTEPPSSLGDLPLIVLSRGESLSLADVPEIDGITQEDLDDATRVGMALQHELAGLSTNSEHRVVPESGHYIHWDQPTAVVEAILEIASR